MNLTGEADVSKVSNGLAFAVGLAIPCPGDVWRRAVHRFKNGAEFIDVCSGKFIDAVISRTYGQRQMKMRIEK